MHEILERETKWDVDGGFVLPNLDDVVTGGTVEHDTVELVSTYYDTPQRDLQAYGIVVRRRLGDTDMGWQVKVPDAEGRIELRWPPAEKPPAELSELLTGVRLGKNLVDIATIHTVRQRYRINGTSDGAACAELADDYVRAWSGERLLAWREIEIERRSQTASFPDLLIERLAAAGAQPSRYSSKLSHVSAPALPPEATSPAGQAVARYLTAQIDQFVRCDIGLRRGLDPVHDCRVAARRLRSTLKVFGKLLRFPEAADVDADLKWFAGLLGDVRDCQVQRRRFCAALDELPDELVLGPVKSRIRADLRATELPARTGVAAAMNSERYLVLMTVLRRWRRAAPIPEDTAAKKLRKRADRANAKADRRLGAAVGTGDSAMLHRARKAAKRARYAAELLGPFTRTARSRRTMKHYKRIQRVLGDHQDSIVAAETLRRMASGAGTTAGENGFTYGLLYARERSIAAGARRDAEKLL